MVSFRLPLTITQFVHFHVSWWEGMYSFSRLCIFSTRSLRGPCRPFRPWRPSMISSSPCRKRRRSRRRRFPQKEDTARTDLGGQWPKANRPTWFSSSSFFVCSILGYIYPQKTEGTTASFLPSIRFYPVLFFSDSQTQRLHLPE